MRNAARTLLTLCLTVTLHAYASAQTGRPDEVADVGGVLFAYYKAENKTIALMQVAEIFDNSTTGFSYVHGAQHIDCFLTYEFAGRTPAETPTAVTLAFESRSKSARLGAPFDRIVRLMRDGLPGKSYQATLDKTTLIGLVTWEQASVRIPLSDLNSFFTAKDTAVLQFGPHDYPLNATQFAAMRKFVGAVERIK